MEQYREAGEWPPLPECSVTYLVDHLMDIGPVLSNGMGRVPIGWRDMGDWQSQTGFDLHPWECRILRSASSEYLSELMVSEEPDHPMPWQEMARIIERRDEVGKKVAGLFRSLAGPVGKSVRKP